MIDAFRDLTNRQYMEILVVLACGSLALFCLTVGFWISGNRAFREARAYHRATARELRQQQKIMDSESANEFRQYLTNLWRREGKTMLLYRTQRETKNYRELVGKALLFGVTPHDLYDPDGRYDVSVNQETIRQIEWQSGKVAICWQVVEEAALAEANAILKKGREDEQEKTASGAGAYDGGNRHS